MATSAQEIVAEGHGGVAENGQALFGGGFSTSAVATGIQDVGNLDVFGASGFHDINMAFDEDVPIRERACSWDLAMDQDVDPANDPMTPAIGSHSHSLPPIPVVVGESDASSGRGNFNSFASDGVGNNEPPIFDDNLQFVDPIPVEQYLHNDGRESDDGYDISNGIGTRYPRHRHHGFNLRNSGMQLEGQFGPGFEEPKKKRKAKARQKSPKLSHVSSDMSLKKRCRKPGKGSGTGKHESRKFDAQMRPRIKGRFVSRKMYQDLYGDGDEDGESNDNDDGENKSDDDKMGSSHSSSSLDTDAHTSNTSTDVEALSATSNDEGSVAEKTSEDAVASDEATSTE